MKKCTPNILIDSIIKTSVKNVSVCAYTLKTKGALKYTSQTILFLPMTPFMKAIRSLCFKLSDLESFQLF